MSSFRGGPGHFTEASAPPVAAYRYDALSDLLWWAPEMYALYGFREGEVVPTLELMEAHTHEDDRAQVRKAICPSWEAGLPFTSRHRIIDAQLVVHDVLTVGESIRSQGYPVTVHGYFVDVTSTLRKDVRANVAAALSQTFRTRGVIEQVKGALMLAYGLDEDSAFTLLRGYSNNHNVNLAKLASYVARQMSTAEVGGEPAQQTLFEILASVAEDRSVVDAEPDDEPAVQSERSVATDSEGADA